MRDDEDDDLDASDGDGWDDDEPTIPCPYCRREILEDTPRCPHCEHYLSAEDAPAARMPPWVLLTALVCLGIVGWWIVAGR